MDFDNEIFSETLKKIREGKGLTQKEITDGLMSRTTYSKIERGINVPGMTNFYNILYRLNIEFEEFFYFYNNHTYDERSNILNEFKNTRGNFDVKKLTNIITMCQNFKKSKDDNLIRNIQNVCNALLEVNNNNLSEANLIAQKVWDDLSKRDTWFFDDILIINNIFFIFKEDTFNEMYKRAIKYLEKYHSFNGYWGGELKFSLEFNKLSYDIFLINDNSEGLIKKIDSLITKAREFRYYDMEAVLFIRKGMILNHTKLMNKGINILKALELKDLLSAVNKEINIYGFTLNNSEIQKSSDFIYLK